MLTQGGEVQDAHPRPSTNREDTIRYDDQIVYSELEKSLFEKKIRKEWRQGLLETGSVKKTQRRSMNILSTEKEPVSFVGFWIEMQLSVLVCSLKRTQRGQENSQKCPIRLVSPLGWNNEWIKLVAHFSDLCIRQPLLTAQLQLLQMRGSQAPFPP